MNKEVLLGNILENWSFRPTKGQMIALERMTDFLFSGSGRQVFVLRGYAGTGKTTVVSALVRTLRQHRGKVQLMAPTGRAAKVFSLYSGIPAVTIHKQIYRQKSITDDTVFSLDRNLHENTLFFVDEASMISNEGLAGAQFGTGRLLDDLISYVYGGKGCAMVLIGDAAQLPPVGEVQSPALISRQLASYGLEVYEASLQDVMRQSEKSGILENATRLRMSLPPADSCDPYSVRPFMFCLKGFTDICRIDGSELIEKISWCYSNDGVDETMVLCRSNKRAIMYNNGIRNTILDREDELSRGDNLMVVKNSYYWTEHVMEDSDKYDDYSMNVPPFIANGDIAVVKRVRKIRELYGFRFADVLLDFPDYDEFDMEVTLLLDTLHSEAPALTQEQHEQLFANVMQDYEHIRSKKERMKKLREDIYYNAMQVKYAYAVTCHKAQGGQWKNIFIDQGYMPEENRDADYYRWLYTALTRATGRVYLVNWPKEQIEE